MKRKLLYCAIFLIGLFMFILVGDVVNADNQKESITIKSSQILKGHFDTNRCQDKLKDFEVIKNVTPDEKKAEEKEQNGNCSKTNERDKYSFGVSSFLDSNKQDEKIEILVISEWDVTEEEFLEVINRAFGSVKYQKLKFDTISFYADSSMIKILAEQEEIFKILLPDENTEYQFIDENECRGKEPVLRLNASGE